MNNSKLIFHAILKDYLQGNIHNYVISEEILTLADSHQLSAIFYHMTKDERLKKAYQMQIYSQIHIKHVLQELDTLVHDYIVFKGATLQKYYPTPLLRTMGDIDILVPDREVVETIIMENGFELDHKEKHPNGTWVYQKYGISLEIHKQITHHGKTTALFENPKEHADGNELELTYHMAFVIYHLYEHFLKKGVGYRQFLDVAVLSKQDIEWDRLSIYLTELEILDFARVVFSLNYYWWDIKTPLTQDLEDAFGEQATEQIFDNGVFGHGRSLDSISKIRTVSKGRLYYFKKIIFPTYDFLLFFYPKLPKKLILIGWVMNWGRLIVKAIRNKGFIGARIRENTMNREDLQKGIEELHNWGIK